MPDKFQLSIRHMFYAMALIVAGLAVTPLSLVLSALILIWWTLFAFRKTTASAIHGQEPNHAFARRMRASMFWLAAAVIAIGLCMPSIQINRGGGRLSCANNMRQIMIAMHLYKEANGRFPPAYIADESTGEPMHSWRVLILPFMEGNIYDQYDFDEPWNGPNNSKLASQTSSCFSCPLHGTEDGLTTYKVISDTGAAFDNAQPGRFPYNADGTSNLIVLVEDTKDPINWMQPDDVDIDTAIKILTEDTKHHHVKEETFRRTIYGNNFGASDGSVRTFLPGEIRPEDLRRLMLIGDGGFHDVSLGYRMQATTYGRVEAKYGAYIGLVLYIALALLPCRYFPMNPK